MAAISGGAGIDSRPKRPAKKIIPQGELDAMVTDSLKDVASDEDLSVDENDPELLGELGELTGMKKHCLLQIFMKFSKNVVYI